MNEPLHNFIEALREELKEYGEMLALLDYQQSLVINRQTDGLLESVSAINAQGETLQAVRRERDQRRLDLLHSLQMEESLPLKALLPRLPVEYRPLIEALVRENQELLGRIQQRARQNHLLLSRVVELMQKLINTILPSGAPPTYTDAGRIQSPLLSEHRLCDAIS